MASTRPVPPAAARYFLKLGCHGGLVSSPCTTRRHCLLLRPGGSDVLPVAALGGGGYQYCLLLGYGGGGGRAAPSRCTASDDNAAPSSDAVAFCAAMKQAKDRSRAMALMGASTSVLDQIANMADEARVLLGHMLMKQPVPLPQQHLFEEMVRIGTTFVEVERQCREGYVRADAMLTALKGLKRMSAVFLNSVEDLPGYSELLPLSSSDVIAVEYFKNQSNSFLKMLYIVKCKWHGVPFHLDIPFHLDW